MYITHQEGNEGQAPDFRRRVEIAESLFTGHYMADLVAMVECVASQAPARVEEFDGEMDRR